MNKELDILYLDDEAIEDPSFEKGVAYLDAQHYDSAHRCFETLLEQDPTSPLRLCLVGLSNSLMKRYTDASFYYMKTLELDPDYDPAKVLLGEVHCALADFANGIPLLQEIVARYQQDAKTWDTAPAIYKRAYQGLTVIKELYLLAKKNESVVSISTPKTVQ